MKLFKNILAVTIFTTAIDAAYATPLKSLGVASICSTTDVFLEPTQVLPILMESTWANVLNSKAAKDIFDVKRIDSYKIQSNSIRDSVSTSHVIQELTNKFEPIMNKTMKAIGDGSLNPVQEFKTYSREELQKRLKSQAEFNKKNVTPVLRDAYRFMEDVYHKREQLRQIIANETPKNKFVELMEQQKNFLNNQLKQLVPSVVEKFGEISDVDLNNAPFSYRDGYIVKIRLSKKNGDKKQSITLYPRLLLNQLMGKDAFFLQAMKMWVDYAEAQFESQYSTKMSILGFVQDLVGYSKADDDLRIRRAIFEQAKTDFQSAKIISTLLANLTDKEILSLFDLFNALQGENLPKCSSAIRSLNAQMKSALKGHASSKTMSAEDKKKVDNLSKDIVFYQDYYNVFSTAAAFQISRQGKK